MFFTRSPPISAQAKAVTDGFMAHLAAGDPAEAPEVTALAEEHRQQITRWFYDCSLEMHLGLAEMYLADPRFRKTYEDLAPGLAEYVAAAVRANAAQRA